MTTANINNPVIQYFIVEITNKNKESVKTRTVHNNDKIVKVNNP